MNREVDFDFELPDITVQLANLLVEDGDIKCHLDTQSGRLTLGAEGNVATWIVTEIIRLAYTCLAVAAGEPEDEDPMESFDYITRNAKRIIEHNTVEVE